MSTQEIFDTVYRGRQSFLHHCAYMRMGEVLLAQRMLRLAGIGLTQKDFFDYGFGAGTFYRYRPTSAQLSGVEQDPVVCQEVAKMLGGWGNRQEFERRFQQACRGEARWHRYARGDQLSQERRVVLRAKPVSMRACAPYPTRIR